jgi:hypothetical protein
MRCDTMDFYLNRDINEALIKLSNVDLMPGGRIVVSQLSRAEADKCIKECGLSYDPASVASALVFVYKCKRYLKTGQCLNSWKKELDACNSTAKEEALKLASRVAPEPSAVMCESDLVHIAVMLPECNGLAVVTVSPAGHAVTHLEGAEAVESGNKKEFRCRKRRVAKPNAAKGDSATEYLNRIVSSLLLTPG